MQQAALTAVHGREGVRHTGPDYPFSGGLSLHTQLLGAQGLEVGGVKADQVILALIKAQHLRGDGLQGAQQLAVVLRNQRHVGPSQFDIDLARLNSLGVASAVSGGNAVLEAHSTQLVQGGEESGDLLGSLLQVGDGHNKPVSQSGAVNGLRFRRESWRFSSPTPWGPDNPGLRDR